MSYIVTHDGKAHFDEMKACADVIHTTSVDRIERREPTAEELEDPSVWVLDEGGLWEPWRNNYDHHGVTSTDCCFSMVLSAMDMSRAFQDAFGWYIPKIIRDNKGNAGVAQWANIGTAKLVGCLMSNPIESWLLDEFGSHQVIRPGDFVWECLKRLGENLFSHVAHLDRRMEDYANHSQLVQAAGLSGLFMPAVNGMERGAFGMDQFRRRFHPDIGFTITPDTRGSGYSLYRYDELGLDFRKVRLDDRVKFVHQGGFTASTHSLLPLEELVELVDRCAVLYCK